MVTQVGDEHLSAIHEKRYGAIPNPLAESLGQILVEVWSTTIDEVVAMLPDSALDLATRGPARAAAKPGRNAPCPCGSQKKFKRCCAETAPVAVDPREIRAARLRRLEPQLDGEQVAQLSRVELAQLDLTRLPGGTVIDVMRRQARLRDWSRACLANDEILRRFGKEQADECLQEVVYAAMAAHQYDAAARMFARLEDPLAAAPIGLELEMATRPADSLISRLEEAALGAVRKLGKPAASELADLVLRTAPALGILLGRGAVPSSAIWPGESLLDWIEEARDDLGLPPEDPAQLVFDALGGVRKEKADAALADAERKRLSETVAELRTNLDDVNGRVNGLEQQLAAKERDLERAERVAAESN
jgi:hypothetical protein